MITKDGDSMEGKELTKKQKNLLLAMAQCTEDEVTEVFNRCKDAQLFDT